MYIFFPTKIVKIWEEPLFCFGKSTLLESYTLHGLISLLLLKEIFQMVFQVSQKQCRDNFS